MNTFKQFGKICCVSCCLVLGATAVAQEIQSATDAIAQELSECLDHMSTAFSTGPKITRLDPDVGVEIVQKAWPTLANDMVKTGVLKTFAFSKGLPEKHPRLLQVLHLGMTDESDYVRNYAAGYLASHALQDFSNDAKGYQQWYAQYGAMSLQELRTASKDKLLVKVQELADALSQANSDQIFTIAIQLGNFGDPLAIPYLIGMIEADNTYDTVYGIGWFGLNALTNVQYSDDHDGAWWRQWWEQNKTKFPLEVQQIDIPNYQTLAEQGKVKRKKQELAKKQNNIADIPSKLLQAAGDENMTYFLIGPKDGDQPPNGGYKLLVILPGGDGSKDFHPFVKRIFKNAVPDNYLAVQLVAPKWTEDQVIVWPHKNNKVTDMKFSTEEFIEGVIVDVKKQFVINTNHVFTLSWSSSGPAAYAASLQENKSITGSYVSMSVFKSDYLPDLANAKSHNYYIEHSPEDRVCPLWMAKEAQKELSKNGANVNFVTYQGGHGWRGNAFERLRNGIEWLESNANSNIEIIAAQN